MENRKTKEPNAGRKY